jgi:membrane associated rhomboid family serine protease
MSELVSPPPSAPVSRSLAATTKRHAVLLFGLLAIMWITALLDVLPFLQLNQHGIHPRTVSGLIGILCAPFLHAGFSHLAANSLPFIVLGGIVLLGGRTVFWSVTLFVILFGGLGVWLFGGAHSNHIGASGLIFGYLGFLLARGFVERSWTWSLVALVILVLYGGVLIGVLPLQVGVSWQSHLFGFLAGIGAARLLFSRQRRLIGGARPELEST